ncbi:MAG: hypothetical protein Q4A65_04750 [Bacillota bacterium]|nr:hypothetical protein [Bacillota bacterium]
MKRKLLYFILAIVLCLTMLPANVMAGENDVCQITVSEGPLSIEMYKGGLEYVNPHDIFADSQDHELEYTIEKADAELKATITPSGLLKLAPLTVGEFEATISAACTENTGVKAEATVPVKVLEPKDEGEPVQYGYDETPAESVRLFVTISNDGIPLMGNDISSTVLSHLEVEVPYFDLALYGLEDNYRYHTKDGKGPYINDVVVERPTAMHLMIYLIERYYMGIPEARCCQGTSGITDFSTPQQVRYMSGDIAYRGAKKAYYLTGGATSTYMQEVWGHDENLMYYRNHVFPLMSPGWGATADYILLSDGDAFDLAMFTDWNFYQQGSFCSFDKELYEVDAGESAEMTLYRTATGEMGSGRLQPVTGLTVEVYDDDWSLIDTLESETESYQYIFDEPGRYHLVGIDEMAGTEEANKSPAAADVIVTAPCAHEDVSKVDAVSATCTEPGNIECWQCNDCGKYFSDEELSMAIAPNDIMIDARGHSYADGVCERCGLRGDTKVNFVGPGKDKTSDYGPQTQNAGLDYTFKAGNGIVSERITKDEGVDPPEYEFIPMKADANDVYTIPAAKMTAGGQVDIYIDISQAEIVLDMIESIGEVTADSEAAINAAREAYDALTDEEKEEVGAIGLLKLVNAELKFSLIKNQEEMDAQKTLIEALATPSKTQIKSVTNETDGVMVRWDNVAGATGYILMKSEDGAQETVLADITAEETAYKDADANVNGNTYTYSIIAYRTIGDNAYKGEASDTKATVFLNAETIKKAKSSKKRTMTVTWEPNDKATGYEIQYVTGKTSKAATVDGAAAKNKTIKKLKRKKTYAVKVRSFIKSEGVTYYSAWSETKKAKVK